MTQTSGNRPLNDFTIEPLYSDIQVAKMLDPSGDRIKPRSIRSEREAGRLVGTKIAGKWLYRASDISAFLSAAREIAQCHAQIPVPGSPSSAKKDGHAHDGIFVGPRPAKNLSGQRLSMPPILGELANSSKSGCTKDGEPREPAPVIPIRSGLPTS
jgi:hypothetical protein